MARRLEIELTMEQSSTLRMWTQAGKTEQRLAQRANVILHSAQGLTVREVSKRSGISPQNLTKWKKRFIEMGIDGLMDERRPGRPKTISPKQRLRVTELATSKPPKGRSSWTVRSLAEHSGLSATTVHRILNEGQLKPHKVEYWRGRSPDPEFEKKQAAILGLYLEPPDNALVLCVDEKSQIQALDRTQPQLPMRPGNLRRQTASYKRNGTTCLLAALSVHDGEITARCRDKNDHQSFLSFLKTLYRKYPGKQLFVICDNLSVHKHHEVKAWAEKRRRLTIMLTPTYASWLNQVEIFFNIFTKAVLKGAVWVSKKQLIDQSMFYIRKYNEEARPFAWTYIE